MARTKISQREARRLKRRVEELESMMSRQRSRWASDFPGGVHIATLQSVDPCVLACLKTARKLKNAVVAIDQGASMMFFAVPVGGTHG